MKPKLDGAVDAFNRDVVLAKGYEYTTNGRLSSLIANRRQSDAILAAAQYQGRKVLDIGCGDGTYTLQLYDEAGPAEMTGIDPATEAIKVATMNKHERKISFSVENAYRLPFADASFDIAVLRGVLHHMDTPIKAIQEALRVSRTIVILEPNGYNPVLKLIEKTSRYHIEHGEKSYPPCRLKRWIRSNGGQVQKAIFIGLVPYFCPDWMARILRALTPLFEAIPLVRSIACGNSVIVATRAPRQ